MTIGKNARRWIARAAMAAALWCAGVATVQAQAPDMAYFKNKTVRIVVGYGAGGGFDLYARMIAPYLARTLGAQIVIENQPGAGGITALNRMMTAPPDGLQISLVNGMAAAFAQFISQQGVRYDLAKLEHLGTVSGSPWVWLVNVDSPYASARQVVEAKRKFMWTAGGPIDGLSDGAAFVCEALKLDCGIVLGYPGSNESAMSVANKEMDMMYIVDTSAANYVKGGQIRVLASMGRTRSSLFPGVPTLYKSVDVSPDGASLLDFHATAEKIGRILVAPPGTPPDKIAALRDAVKAALTDPALIAEGDKTQRTIAFMNAEETRKATLGVVSDPTPEQKARMIEILSRIERK